jgi:hypothetical protein
VGTRCELSLLHGIRDYDVKTKRQLICLLSWHREALPGESTLHEIDSCLPCTAAAAQMGLILGSSGLLAAVVIQMCCSPCLEVLATVGR